MKLRLLAVTVLLIAGKAYATDYNRISPSANAFAGAASYSQGGASSANINNAYSNQSPDYGDLRIVPPAIAPSTSTNVICPIVQQGSKAGSVFFFSGSGTTSPEINAVCLAWHQGDKELIHAIACADSSSYKKASEKLGRSCK